MPHAWKNSSSFGIENSHIALFGSYNHYAYCPGPSPVSTWWTDMVFKDTGTDWKDTWGNNLYAGSPLCTADSGSLTVIPSYNSTSASMKFSFTTGGGKLAYDVSYALAATSKYIQVKVSVRNVGSTSVSLSGYRMMEVHTAIAGDFRNDYWYIPGTGQGTFTGTTEDHQYAFSEPWIAAWDQAKREGLGIVLSSGPLISSDSASIYDWYSVCACSEGYYFSQGPYSLVVGSTYSYSGYYLLYQGYGPSAVQDFYHMLVASSATSTSSPTTVSTSSSSSSTSQISISTSSSKHGEIESRLQLYQWYANSFSPYYWGSIGQEYLSNYANDLLSSYSNPVDILIESVKQEAVPDYVNSLEDGIKIFVTSVGATRAFDLGYSLNCIYLYGNQNLSTSFITISNLIKNGEYKQADAQVTSLISTVQTEKSWVDSSFANHCIPILSNITTRSISAMYAGALNFLMAEHVELSNSLTITAHSPVDILVTDPSGRRVGFDSETNSTMVEILGATFSGTGTEPEQVFIPAPINGSYKISAFGRDSGTYTIDISFNSYDNKQLALLHQSTSITKGQTESFGFTLTGQTVSASGGTVFTDVFVSIALAGVLVIALIRFVILLRKSNVQNP